MNRIIIGIKEILEVHNMLDIVSIIGLLTIILVYCFV